MFVFQIKIHLYQASNNHLTKLHSLDSTDQKTSKIYTKMSRQAKPLSMKESCEVFQRRNRRIFGERTLAEQQEPPKVASPSFEKGRENPSPFKNSNTLSNHLPPVNEQQQQTRQPRPRSKMARVAVPRHIKHTVVIRHRTPQRQPSLFPNIQGQQRKPQQAKMVSTKPSVARQHDTEQNTEGSGGRAAFTGDTMIYRPCLPHTSLAVPGSKTAIPQNETNVTHLKPETVLAREESSESKQSTEKHQGPIKQKQEAKVLPPLAVPGAIPRKTTMTKRKSGRHLKSPSASAQQNPSENKQSLENHQNATKQQRKQRARDDRIKPTAGRRVADMNQVMQHRRQETRELVRCSGRRTGLCTETDPAQQHLTFIRVLRKRF